MADVNFRKRITMPSPANPNDIIFLKDGLLVSMYICDSEGTPFGVIPAGDYVKQVNGAGGNVQLNLSFSGGSLNITGGNNAINLDNRYFKTTDHIGWGAVDNKPTTLSGYGITDAYTKTESDAITGLLSNLSTSTKTNLVSAINELLTSINEGMRTPDPIDCSTNPNYPASEEGDTYKVTAAGKIGGENGKVVEVNDTIVCTATNGGGDQATVGGSFYIIQGNITDATTSVKGLGRIATQAEVTAGENATAWVTPATLAGMGYLTSFSETDPIFSASPAGGISNSDITNWDAKVDPARKIIAGSGLTGGGDLSANRTLSIDPDYSSFTNYYTKTQSDGRYLQNAPSWQAVTDVGATTTNDVTANTLKLTTPPASTSAASKIFVLGADGHTISTRTASEILDDIGANDNFISKDANWVPDVNETHGKTDIYSWGSTSENNPMPGTNYGGGIINIKGTGINPSDFQILFNTQGDLGVRHYSETTNTWSTPDIFAKQNWSNANFLSIGANTGASIVNYNEDYNNIKTAFVHGAKYALNSPSWGSAAGGSVLSSYYDANNGFATQLMIDYFNSNVIVRSMYNGVWNNDYTLASEDWVNNQGFIRSDWTTAGSIPVMTSSDNIDANTVPGANIFYGNAAYGTNFGTTGPIVSLKAQTGAGAQLQLRGGSVSELWFRGVTNDGSGTWLQAADRGWVQNQNYLTSIPVATSSVLGGVKIGTRLSITQAGTLSADKQTDNNFTNALLDKLNGIDANANNYTLPTASFNTLGGVKVGSTLKIASSVLDAKTATASALGIVKPGSNMAVDGNGALTMEWAEVEW